MNPLPHPPPFPYPQSGGTAGRTGEGRHGFSKVSPAVLQPPRTAAVIAANALGDEGWERVNGTLERPWEGRGGG